MKRLLFHVGLILVLTAHAVAAPKTTGGLKKPSAEAEPLPAEIEPPPKAEPAGAAPPTPAGSQKLTPAEFAKMIREKYVWAPMAFAVPPDFNKRPFTVPKSALPLSKPMTDAAGELKTVEKTSPKPTLSNVRQIPAGMETINCLELSDDGRILVVGKHAGPVTVWDVETGEKLCQVAKDYRAAITALCVSPDGRHLAVGSMKSGVQVFDVRSGVQKFEHNFFGTGVHSLFMTHDGAWLFGMDNDGKIGGYPLLGGMGFAMGQTVSSEPAKFMAMSRKGKSIFFGCTGAEAPWAASLMPIQEVQGQKAGATIPTTLPKVERQRHCFAASNYSVALTNGNADVTVVRHFPPKGANTLPLMSIRIPFRLSGISQCGLTPDDSHVLGINPRGLLEIRSIEVLSACEVLPLPVDLIQVSAISEDARTIAVAGPDGVVHIQRLDRFSEGSILRFWRIVRDALHRKDYDRLETFSEILAKRTEPFEWAPRSVPLDLLLSAVRDARHPLDNPEGVSIVKRLTDWAAARPKSIAARLALADIEIGEAWRQRGREFINTVSEERLKSFVEHAEAARNHLDKVSSRKDLPPSYLHRRLSVMRALGWDPNVADEIEKALLRQSPEYVSAHESIAGSLLARWYGNADTDPEAYARRVADKVGGDSGDALYAQIGVSLTQLFKPKEYFEKTGFDYDRMQRGFTALMKKSPEEPTFRNMAIRIAYYRQDKETAARLLKDFQEADWRGEVWKYAAYLDARRWALPN